MQNDSGFFMCSICSREFSGLNSLKKHIPIHTRRVQHKCDVCGHVFGKIKSLRLPSGKTVKDVGPSWPAEISGLAELPAAGDRFFVVKDIAKAKSLADERQERLREDRRQTNLH